ncbi:hypothetical protein RvY_01581 [Ramazzottius varieornatus]|uniref:Uncharacterized protein n=1 Tax=Ramazzottius varieornatus TaxID=947166 RepID=A0A1D1UNX4_RAMVA|nr:hypothetical protein RvY_01581 [Ramazzottius varieornatus]
MAVHLCKEIRVGTRDGKESRINYSRRTMYTGNKGSRHMGGKPGLVGAVPSTAMARRMNVGLQASDSM